MQNKSVKVLLALGGIVVAGLLMGATLGRMDDAAMVYRAEPQAKLRGTSVATPDPDSGEAAVEEERRHSAYAYSTRPDYDYDAEIWPEDQGDYEFDPDFMDDDDLYTRRAWRRESGRDQASGTREYDFERDFVDTDPVRSGEDRFADVRRDTPSVQADIAPRYRSLPPPPVPTARPREAERAATPPPEPRAADGQLPAIW